MAVRLLQFRTGGHHLQCMVDRRQADGHTTPCRCGADIEDVPTPPSSIPQQTKVESGEPKATSGPGGGNISVSAIFYISWHPQFPTQNPFDCLLLAGNSQLSHDLRPDRNERSESGLGGGCGREGF